MLLNNMDTLKYIMDKFAMTPFVLDRSCHMPIEIPNFDREGLTHLFRELGFETGVEIGVRGGEFSEMIMQNNPGIWLYGIDPYEPHAGYRDITRRSTFNKYLEDAHARLDIYSPHFSFFQEYSADALKHFADNSLDFVYIDGDHSFLEVAFDIEKWSRKVRPGGIISGDDYFKHRGQSNIDVYQVVNAYTDAKGIKPWFVLGSKAIVPGEKRDSGRSFMWVKQ